jgi:hypothetical protein
LTNSATWGLQKSAVAYQSPNTVDGNRLSFASGRFILVRSLAVQWSVNIVAYFAQVVLASSVLCGGAGEMMP